MIKTINKLEFSYAHWESLTMKYGHSFSASIGLTFGLIVGLIEIIGGDGLVKISSIV